MYAIDMLLCVCRTAILRELGHASKEGMETLKGCMACMISTWGPCAVQSLSRQACMPRHELFPVTEVQKFPFMQDFCAAQAGACDEGGRGDPKGARGVRDQHRG